MHKTGQHAQYSKHRPGTQLPGDCNFIFVIAAVACYTIVNATAWWTSYQASCFIITVIIINSINTGVGVAVNFRIADSLEVSGGSVSSNSGIATCIDVWQSLKVLPQLRQLTWVSHAMQGEQEFLFQQQQSQQTGYS